MCAGANSSWILSSHIILLLSSKTQPVTVRVAAVVQRGMVYGGVAVVYDMMLVRHVGMLWLGACQPQNVI